MQHQYRYQQNALLFSCNSPEPVNLHCLAVLLDVFAVPEKKQPEPG